MTGEGGEGTREQEWRKDRRGSDPGVGLARKGMWGMGGCRVSKKDGPQIEGGNTSKAHREKGVI